MSKTERTYVFDFSVDHLHKEPHVMVCVAELTLNNWNFDLFSKLPASAEALLQARWLVHFSVECDTIDEYIGYITIDSIQATLPDGSTASLRLDQTNTEELESEIRDRYDWSAFAEQCAERYAAAYEDRYDR